ncbi:MAG: transporter substrate-binding domain-containing protein [Actinomycetaceae bacterium]|nr:transporter substrate-binding domain-containing protein [Actinomycetaceae bacterium]
MRRSVLVLLLAASVILVGCSPREAGLPNAGYDLSELQSVESIAAMVPQDVKERGVLRNGAAIDYPPAEFTSHIDGKTSLGYDIDIARALAKVMGLSGAETTHTTFEKLLDQVGTNVDLSISSFTISPSRSANYAMISYIEVGSQFAVAKGNPTKFDPFEPCGKTIGVQKGSYQEAELLPTMSQACEQEGKDTIVIKAHQLQTEIAPKVIAGQYDAALADSPVIDYTISQFDEELETVGDIVAAAKQGIVISKDNRQLIDATALAMQELMDNGTLAAILSHYGVDSLALKTAKIYEEGKS